MMAGNIWRDFEWVAEVRPKRKRNEIEWAKNNIKRMKAEGKEAFSEATRATVLANFNEIGSSDGQNVHLVAFITATESRGRSPNVQISSYAQKYRHHYKGKCGDE